MSRLSIALLLGSVFAAPPAEISGRVIDAQTGEPVARAHLKAWVFPSGGQGVELAILTDAAGNFNIRNLPDGPCNFIAEKPGYVTAPARLIVAAADPKPASVVIYMTRQAAIEGSVVDEKGVGVPLASIHVIKQVIVEGRRQFQNVYGSQTDETGNFRAFGLTAGRYYLAAMAPHRSKALAYPPVFYPAATGVHGAQPIDLRPGREEQVEIRLRAVTAHEIRGQITPAARSAGFTLRPKDADLFSIGLNVRTYRDGRTGIFKISGAPSGVYVLEVSAFSDSQQRYASTTVVVGDKDVDGIMLAPGRLPPLAGRVKIEGADAPRVGWQIGIHSPHRQQFGTQIDPEGNFRFNDVPADTYRVTLPLSGSFYVRSIRQGDRDLSADRLVTIGDAAPEPLDIGVSSRGATVEGTVPLPDVDQPRVHVVLLRRTGEGMILEKEAYASGDPAAIQNIRARYSMQGVAPGEYVLFAWPQGSQIEYANPETMGQYDALGKPVSVTEGAKITVFVEHLLPKVEP